MGLFGISNSNLTKLKRYRMLDFLKELKETSQTVQEKDVPNHYFYNLDLQLYH